MVGAGPSDSESFAITEIDAITINKRGKKRFKGERNQVNHQKLKKGEIGRKRGKGGNQAKKEEFSPKGGNIRALF